MQKKPKRVIKKLGEFAESRRQQAIVSITNATATGMILKWLFTNKTTVTLFLILLFGGAFYQYQLDYYKDLADHQRIQELKQDLSLEKLRTSKLNKEIQALKAKKVSDLKINEEFRKTLSSLSAQKKKELLLAQTKRLLEKRRNNQ